MTTGTSWSQSVCSKLIVTGHPDFPPISWQSGSTLKGFGPTLISSLAEQIKLPVLIQNFGSWGKAQQAVMSGKADVIVGLYKTPERQQWLSYISTPIYSDTWGVITTKGKEFTYQGPTSLKGKRGLTMDSESFEAELDRLITSTLTVRRVPNQIALFEEVKKGNTDYAIVPFISPVTHKQLKQSDKDLIVISDNFLTSNLYIAIRRESPCRQTVENFSRTILAWKNAGKLEQMMQETRQHFDQK